MGGVIVGSGDSTSWGDDICIGVGVDIYDGIIFWLEALSMLHYSIYSFDGLNNQEHVGLSIYKPLE